MNEDAQAALLKTLEEPPSGATIILCADAEEPLLPTIRSRCARIRLGPVGVRDIERILAEAGAVDPPVAARVARISGGRPGIALAWVRQADALRDRDSITRGLIDVATSRPADRLASVRALASSASAIAGIGDGGSSDLGAGDTSDPAGKNAGRRKRSGSANAPTVANDAPASASEDADAEPEASGPARAPAAERRRAAEALIALWTDLARDIAVSQHGLDRSIRDLASFDEARALADLIDPDDLLRFIDRLGRAAVLVRGNASAELVLDDLALAWPRPRSGTRAA
jgi:DNA polymerase-3 subunit delta'